MRILVLSHRTWKLSGGERFYPMGEWLASRGHDVTIVYFGNNNVSRPSAIERSGLRAVLLPHLPPRDSPTPGLRATVERFSQYLANLTAKSDVVHSEVALFPLMAAPTLFERQVRGVPLVLDWVDQYDGGPPYVRMLKYYVHRLASHITVVSEALKNWVMRDGVSPQMITKIPMGSDIRRIKNLPKDEARRSVGISDGQVIIGYEYGQVHFSSIVTTLRTMQRIAKEHGRAKLAFIGRFDSDGVRDKIVAMTQRFGLRDNVIFTGELPEEKLSPWLSACDVLLMPMDSTVANDRARFPGRMGDYLAAGRPIVANAVGEVTSVINEGPCGLLSYSSDPNEFAERVCTLLSDPELQARMGNNARQLAEGRYSWRNLALELERVYMKVANSPVEER